MNGFSTPASARTRPRSAATSKWGLKPGEKPAPFCAVIMRCAVTGALLVQNRDGQMACFGSRRAPGETPMQCIRRMLDEALDGFEPAEPSRRVALYAKDGRGYRLAAFFFEIVGPRRESGRDRNGQWMLPDALLSDERLTEWHGAALRAWQQRLLRANYPEISAEPEPEPLPPRQAAAARAAASAEFEDQLGFLTL